MGTRNHAPPATHFKSWYPLPPCKLYAQVARDGKAALLQQCLSGEIETFHNGCVTWGQFCFLPILEVVVVLPARVAPIQWSHPGKPAFDWVPLMLQPLHQRPPADRLQALGRRQARELAQRVADRSSLSLPFWLVLCAHRLVACSDPACICCLLGQRRCAKFKR